MAEELPVWASILLGIPITTTKEGSHSQCAEQPGVSSAPAPDGNQDRLRFLLHLDQFLRNEQLRRRTLLLEAAR